MRKRIAAQLTAALVVLLVGTADAATTKKASAGPQTGTATFYSDKLQGHKLASGDTYDKDALTAAHRTLPFGTNVRVTDLKTDKSVVVRINDRGPHGKGQVIEVSRKAAEELGFVKEGKARVKVEVVSSDAK